MGFSVSGSAAIIFVGLFLAFSTAYTASANGFERVSDARSAVNEQALEQRNTAVSIQNVTYDAGNDTLTIDVNNTGATSIPLSAVDVIVDNEYQDDFAVRTVDGNASTDLWLPGEQLHLELSMSTEPTRVKIVVINGVAVTEVI